MQPREAKLLLEGVRMRVETPRADGDRPGTGASGDGAKRGTVADTGQQGAGSELAVTKDQPMTHKLNVTRESDDGDGVMDMTFCVLLLIVKTQSQTDRRQTRAGGKGSIYTRLELYQCSE
jgi:hypothetical protein